MKPLFVIAACLSFATQAFAADPQWPDCRTCHQVQAPDGTVLARGGRAGPNLYGVTGRELAGDTGFRLYSEGLLEAAQTGARWTQDNFNAYLAGPDQFLQSLTGDSTLESGMHVALRADGTALYRWLQEVSR
jgi:cytochrome c